MGLEDRIERQLKRDARDLTVMFIKTMTAILVLFWPIGLIDGDAFAPNPTWWQWALGILAEVIWLAFVLLVAMAIREERKNR